MILFVFIVCLAILLILRFLLVGFNRDRFKIAATDFSNSSNSSIYVNQYRRPVIIKKDKACLIIVTDPVGIERIGTSACMIAKEFITKQFDQNDASINPTEFLKKACFLAHRGISEQMNANSGGCSIALVYINEKELNYASVGDIKIYLNDVELHQINQLDLYKYQLRNRVMEQKISERQLLNNYYRNELTAYLGHENLKKVNTSTKPLPLAKSYKILIATKAVYEAVTMLELEAIAMRKGKPNRKIEILEHIYDEQRQATPKRKPTASAVLVSDFK